MRRETADIILTRAVFPTLPDADTLAIAGGRIAAVGRQEEVAAAVGDGRVLNLSGKTVLPGFIDAHTHLLQTGLALIGQRIDLYGLTREATLARLSEVARSRERDEWIVARGWDESQWEERKYLNRADLDRVTGSHPLVAVRLDGHLVTVNTAALGRIPESVDRTGIDVANGILIERAAFSFLQELAPSETVLVEALRAAVAHANRMGVTSVHVMLPREQMRPFMNTRAVLPLRVTLYPEVPALDSLSELGIDSGFGDHWLRIGGVKLFADGSIGAGNAAVSEPYADSGGIGELNYSDAELVSILEKAEEAGLQTAIHAIGDRAIEQVLAAHVAVKTSPALRHRIEHFELASDEDIERARDLGIAISMQPNFVMNWAGEGKMYDKRLGSLRMHRVDPHRFVLDSGLLLAFGSDSMPMSPLFGVHAAVNAPYASERLAIHEALSCYTAAGACLSHEEEDKGMIAVGMLADLVVLDRDLREDTTRIDECRVGMTLVNGEIVYQRGDEICE